MEPATGATSGAESSRASPTSAASENVGEFITPFNESYQRNNKRFCIKNLRCFPHCLPAHRESGFCGASVELVVRIDCRSDDFLAVSEFRLKPGSVKVEEEDISTDVKAPALRIGSSMTLESISAQARTKKSPTLPWIEPQVVCRATELKAKRVKTTFVPGDDASSQLYICFSKRGWHYSWLSNKHSTDNEHVMRCYLFKRTARGKTAMRESSRKTLGDQVGAQARKDDVYTVVGVYDSPSFKIHCRRRASAAPIAAAAKKRGRSLSLVDSSNVAERKRGRPPSSPRTVPRPHVRAIADLLLLFDDAFNARASLNEFELKISNLMYIETELTVVPDFTPKFGSNFIKNRTALAIELANSLYASADFRESLNALRTSTNGAYHPKIVPQLLKMLLDGVEIFLFDVNASKAQFRRVFTTPAITHEVVCLSRDLSAALQQKANAERTTIDALLAENRALEAYAAGKLAKSTANDEAALAKASSILRELLTDAYASMGDSCPEFFANASALLVQRRARLEAAAKRYG